MKIFADRLNKLMRDTQTSGYRLAKELGVDNQTVLNWQQDKNEPKITHLKMIAEYFDVSTDYLLGLAEY